MRANFKNYNRILLMIFVVTYRISLDWIYKNIIVRYYAHEKYFDSETLPLALLSWLLLFLSMPLIIKIIRNEDRRISSIVIVILYMISYVSYTSCVRYGILQERTIIFNFVYWTVLLTMQIYFLGRPSKRMIKIRIGDAGVEEKIVMLIGVFSILLVLYISAKYAHFRINLNLFKVYDLRAEARGYNLPIIIRYMFYWTRAVNPALFVYCLVKKKHGMAMIYFAAQLLSFGIDGLKSTLFLTCIYAVIGLFYKPKSKKNHKKWIVFVFLGIGVLSVFEYVAVHSKYLVLFLIRRLAFVPNQLSEFYVDFFASHTPDYFRGSFLRFLGFETPYGNVSMLIGNVYFGAASKSCNNGLLSDAVTNLGIIGIVAAPIMVIIFLHLFDKCMDGLDLRIVMCVGIYISNLLLSSFLSTILVTHGALILMILLSKLRREQNEDTTHQQKLCI